MKTDKIYGIYNLARLAEKAQETYKTLVLEYEKQNAIYNAERVSYCAMVEADKKVKKAESDFRKAVRATFEYFGITLKRFDWYGGYRKAYNSLMEGEYGEYRTKLTWEQIDIINDVAKLSKYTNYLCNE